MPAAALPCGAAVWLFEVEWSNKPAAIAKHNANRGPRFERLFIAVSPWSAYGLVRVSVMLPVELPPGSTKMVYVPATGKVWVPIDPPLVPTEVETRFVPSGFRIDTVVLQQIEVPMVTLLISRLTCWPAVPLKVNRAFCPGVVMFTVTAAPPGVIVPVMSVTL